MAKIDFTPLTDDEEKQLQSKSSIDFTSVSAPAASMAQPGLMDRVSAELKAFPQQAIDDINTLGGGIVKGLTLGHAQPPFYQPNQYPNTAEFGEALGSLAPFALGGAGGAELGAGAARALGGRGAAALPLIGEMVGSGVTGAQAQGATPASIGLAAAAPGVGMGIGKVGEALQALTPVEHAKRIFSLLLKPNPENHKAFMAAGNELSDLVGADKNATAAANIIRDNYRSQKDIANKLYNQNVFQPAIEMGLGENVKTPLFDQFSDGLQELMDSPRSGLIESKAKYKSFRENPSLSNAQDLQSALGSEGAALSGSADASDRSIGNAVGATRNQLKQDLYNHLDQRTVAISPAYRDANAFYERNVVPYYKIPQKILQGEDTNPAGFSRYFKDPNLQTTGERGDTTSILNILDHPGNDELTRRVVADFIRNDEGKVEMSDPNGLYKKLSSTVAYRPYLARIPAITKEADMLGSKLGLMPTLGRHLGKAALIGGGAAQALHSGDIAPLIAAGLGTVPAVQAGIRMGSRAAGRALGGAGEVLSRPEVRAALAALGGNPQ